MHVRSQYRQQVTLPSLATDPARTCVFILRVSPVRTTTLAAAEGVGMLNIT